MLPQPYKRHLLRIIMPILYIRHTRLAIFIRHTRHSLPHLLRTAMPVKPKLGRLFHHPPRPLQTPPTYRLSKDCTAPKISLVTPSYNQAHFLAHTLNSVLDQAYPNLEYFVQDGASSDGSIELLKQYTPRLSGWTSVADSGQTQAINQGFSRTDGEIMAWLNSDDILMPGALARVGEYFANHPEVDVIYGHRILIDEQGRELGRWILPEHNNKVLSWADYVPQETLFWRRRIWERCGGQLDESFSFAMDWDLLLRLRNAGANIVRLPYFLGGFRIHHQQKTNLAINTCGLEEMTRLRQRELGRPVSSEEIYRALIPYLLQHIGVDLLWQLSQFKLLRLAKS